jgi:hypothetical protein
MASVGKASVRIRHSLSRQPYGMKIVSVERDIQDGVVTTLY